MVADLLEVSIAADGVGKFICKSAVNGLSIIHLRKQVTVQIESHLPTLIDPSGFVYKVLKQHEVSYSVTTA